MNKREFILSTVKSRISKIDSEAKIILFGSQARNDAKKESDWDFLILTHFEVTRELKNKISDELFETELETDEVLTGIIQNINSWSDYSNTPIYNNILKDGIEI
ncbi:MAG TPA: nucleotidyltransferase domain-containing protein [Draconibacterium sp.]|nr:nucleotidyltransferase domain-containing protein [Draconibacterium sp.]